MVNIFDKDLIFNDRIIIKPKELDIVSHKYKVAFEVNGERWHSDEFILERNFINSKSYHSFKVTQASAVGYKLFFIWEHDWHFHKEIIKKAVTVFLETNASSPILEKMTSVLDYPCKICN